MNKCQVAIVIKSNYLTLWIEIVSKNIYLFSDAANDYSDNMIEQVDMIEVKTEPNESDELFSICKNTNMVANYSSNDRTTSESKNHTLIKF